MPGWTFADVWETVADTLPDAQALVDGYHRRTWAEFNDRSNSLGQFFLNQGCEKGAKVAFYLHNRNEYSELFLACSKVSATHVNTNYRYTPNELEHVWTNSDSEVVAFESIFTDSVDSLRSSLPLVHTYLWIGTNGANCPDWAVSYEEAAATPTQRNVRGPWGRDGDDLVLLYTGGTTGMPKGVMWRQDDLLRATDSKNSATLPPTPDLDRDGYSPAVRERIPKRGPVSLPACPLMHGAGLFNSVNTLSLGGSIVCLPGTRFDIEVFLDTIESEKVKSTFIVGDVFAKPIAKALDAEPERWDISSLRLMISSGVMWGAESKEALLRHHEDLIMVDTYGSSEAIGIGSSVSSKSAKPKPASFRLSKSAVVISEDGQLVEPGSSDIGKVGLRGHCPVGYYKDPLKSAETFPTIDGVRYSVPGDFATIEADGTINLLGRGSVCINTGGEKVFPEEVEEALKLHPSIHDAVAVGVPDDRFGQSVAAVVELEPGASLDPVAVTSHVKTTLAGYKAPRNLICVPSIERAANGKVDYKRWATHAEGVVSQET